MSTASLNVVNRDAVLDLIAGKRQRGAAIVGIFHDQAEREALATRIVDLAPSAVPAEPPS